MSDVVQSTVNNDLSAQNIRGPRGFKTSPHSQSKASKMGFSRNSTDHPIKSGVGWKETLGKLERGVKPNVHLADSFHKVFHDLWFKIHCCSSRGCQPLIMMLP